MRIRLLTAFGLLASLLGASAAEAHCGCHHRPPPVVHHHHCRPAPRRAVARVQHYGYLAPAARSWGEERSWTDERSSSSYDESGGGVVVARRPWATDRFGYLTWPGKTHFAPPSPPVEAPPIEGPPGPPEGWQGPPPPMAQGDERGQDWQGPGPQGGPPPAAWNGQACCEAAMRQGGYDQNWQGPPAPEGWDGADDGRAVSRF